MGVSQMGGRTSAKGSHKLAVLFLAVVLPPAITLVWLGLQFLDQDRSLVAQRELERQDSFAVSAVQSLRISLDRIERVRPFALPEGCVRFELSSQGITAQPASRILWLPIPATLIEAETARFRESEKHEFRGAAQVAQLAYERDSESTDDATRAGALLRLARVDRRSSRWDEALITYRTLTQIRHVAVEGVPVDLLAFRAICAVLERSGKTTELHQQALELQKDLLAGRWVLDEPAWELTALRLEKWTTQPLPVSAAQREFSKLASQLWEEWEPKNNPILEGTRQTEVLGRFTLISEDLETSRQITAVSREVLESWIEEIPAKGIDGSPSLSLISPDGGLLAGPPPSLSGPTNKRLASETGLPWTLVLSPRDPSPLMNELSERRRLLSVGLVAIVLLLAGGSYLLWRVVQRELTIARLQSDFVAAVSHEFRTPLASLRHVTELMQEDDDLPPERRHRFYESLGRNTQRLQRLVESLLDFARMEDKKKPYNMQLIDSGQLVTKVVDDFRHEAEPRGFEIDLDIMHLGSATILADSDSLSNALWNLLDNAVKYSPKGHRIQVSVQQQIQNLVIAVRDNGLGIPLPEQKEIFNRFVRGKEGRRLGIKGTGLGLAMVSNIAQAHGGRIEINSEAGVGSTFQLVLPLKG